MIHAHLFFFTNVSIPSRVSCSSAHRAQYIIGSSEREETDSQAPFVVTVSHAMSAETYHLTLSRYLWTIDTNRPPSVCLIGKSRHTWWLSARCKAMLETMKLGKSWYKSSVSSSDFRITALIYWRAWNVCFLLRLVGVVLPHKRSDIHSYLQIEDHWKDQPLPWFHTHTNRTFRFRRTILHRCFRRSMRLSRQLRTMRAVHLLRVTLADLVLSIAMPWPE